MLSGKEAGGSAVETRRSRALFKYLKIPFALVKLSTLLALKIFWTNYAEATFKEFSVSSSAKKQKNVSSIEEVVFPCPIICPCQNSTRRRADNVSADGFLVTRGGSLKNTGW